MKKLIVLWCMVCAVLLSVKTFAADSDFPPRPDTAIFVHDFAGVLKPDQAKLMNDSLRAFSKRTTNQIMVISVKDIGDYDPKMYAAELGDRWGVGQKKLDNGVIILIKPKTDDSKGKFAICPGRGLGGILPDVECNHIINNKAMPHLKNNDYTAAVWAVLQDVMPACAAEFAPDQKKDDSSDSDGWLWMIGILGGFGGLIAWARHKAKQRLANETPEERAARLAEEEKSRQEAEKMRKLRGAATPTITGLVAKKAREMRKEQERRKQENAEKFGGGSFDGGGASSEW